MSGKRNQKSDAPAIILVHGAWMDGSSWREVIALLQRKGWNVTAVQNSLTSFAEDVSTVVRAIERQRNRVVLVGHGYGGSIISQAGIHAKVLGLVYVAAFAPDVGESSRDTLNATPGSGYASLQKPDVHGFVHLAQEAFVEFFSYDLPNTESQVLAATQTPIHERVLDASLTASASHTKPVFYVVTERDRMILPQMQRQFIECTGAECVSLATGHVPMLTQPQQSTNLILDGVSSILTRQSRS